MSDWRTMRQEDLWPTLSTNCSGRFYPLICLSGHISQHGISWKQFISLTISDLFFTCLISRLDLSLNEWKKYALFEPMKNYTRNLIATDNATFTLLLLCWNPDKESPIHDHPCDGCWLRVCAGNVRETRYAIDYVTDSLEITSDETFESEFDENINSVLFSCRWC